MGPWSPDVGSEYIVILRTRVRAGVVRAPPPRADAAPKLPCYGPAHSTPFSVGSWLARVDMCWKRGEREARGEARGERGARGARGERRAARGVRRESERGAGALSVRCSACPVPQPMGSDHVGYLELGQRVMVLATDTLDEQVL